MITLNDSDDPDSQRTKAYLAALLENLNRAADQPQAVSIDIVDSEGPNAFVVRGGRIFVTTGLLRLLETENGLSMVLAHEWAHQHLRHAIKRQRDR